MARLHSCTSLIEILSDQKATPSAKTQAARAVGILGIVYDASTAVPALTKLVESFEGQVLDATQIALLFYSHIAIAEIGTAEARNFLYQRSKRDYWKTHEGFGKASATKTPPRIVAQGLAIASIAYLGDRDAEDYILDLYRSQEFRESTEEYRGFDLREGDLRWKLTGAIWEVLQEKGFKTEVRALVEKKK